jgi:hypothetical protein
MIYIVEMIIYQLLACNPITKESKGFEKELAC